MPLRKYKSQCFASNEKISKDGVCYGFSKVNNAKVFDDFKLGTPVRVNIYSKDDEDPILIGLKNSGLLNISYEQEMFKRVAILETTDKGRKTNFCDKNNGACICLLYTSHPPRWVPHAKKKARTCVRALLKIWR